MIDIQVALEWFFLMFTLITLPIYILTLITLVKFHKKLQSSFFTMCISTGIADIWLTIHKYIFTTIPRLFFKEDVLYNIPFATFSKMGIWYIYFAQVFGVFLMTLNRFTALVRPMKYKSIWTKKMVTLAIALQWILPFPLIIPQFFPCCYSSFAGSEDSLYPNFIDKTVNTIYFTFDIIMEPGLLATSIVTMYAVSFYKCLKNSKNKIASSAATATAATTATGQNSKDAGRGRKAKAAEIKLAVMGMIISVVYVIMCMTYICFAINYTPAFVTLTFFYASDLFTCINPWALLAFSTLFRKHFVAFLGCQDTLPIESQKDTSVKRQSSIRGPSQRNSLRPQ